MTTFTKMSVLYNICPTRTYDDHRRTAHGAEGGCSLPRNFQIAIFGPKIR